MIAFLQQQVKHMYEDYQPKVLDFSYREYLQAGQTLPPNTFIYNYNITMPIGKGAFGKIYLGRREGKTFALKLIDLEKIKRETNLKVKEIRERLVHSEPRLMMQCNSPNVLKCFEIIENSSLQILVLEYCNGKTLQQLIDENRHLKEEDAVKILRQIIIGIAELHSNRIIHRDLKSENIMEHQGQYKIIDLGFSKKLEIQNELAEVKGTTLGTVITMAPQILAKSSYGLKADIWSLGIIFFQMVFGGYLYSTATVRQRLRQIQQKCYFSPDCQLTFNGITISRQANNFLYRVLEVDTEKRMGWRELLEHPLVKQKEDQSIGSRFLVKSSLLQPSNVDLDMVVIPENLEPKAKSLIYEEPIQYQGSEVEQDKREIEDKQIYLQRYRDVEKSQTFRIDVQYNKKESSVLFFDAKLERRSDKFLKLQKNSEIYQSSFIHDSKQYSEVRKAHLECAKSQLLNQMLSIIQEFRMLDCQKRQEIEFMYLLSSRCFSNLSYLKANVHKARLMQNLLGQIDKLYTYASQRFERYSLQLTHSENQSSQKFKDFFKKRAFSQRYKQIQRFTTGLEKKDYTREQQIDFTYSYFEKIKSGLKILKEKNQYPRNRVEGFLSNYPVIMKIKDQQLYGQTFQEKIIKFLY